MANQNLTTYQRLTKVFGFPGKLEPIETPSFNFSRDELLRTTSKDEYDKSLLQQQQSKYISDKWAKIDKHTYNQSVYNEPNRLASYYDFEGMEMTPEISAALDIFSDESCIIGNSKIPLLNGETKTVEELYNDNTQNFWVYAVDINNDKIKPSKVEKVIFKGEKDTYKVILDDDTEIICTSDHRWLDINNKWVETKDLIFGSKLKSIYRKIDKKDFNNNHTHSIVDESELINEKQKLIDLVELINNHRVVSIEYYGKEKVYDLLNSSVDSNFAVECNNGMIISHNCQLSEKGEILTIFSESPRVKSILNDLFINVLDINTNLPMWTRGMCKYGDDFIYLKINEKEGIIGCQQLPNIEIERVEGGSNSSERRVEDDLNTRELRFRWKNRDIEFQSWEIGHFRLLGDDRKLPYGTSILDKIRRIWKQLILAEDAMLIYRTSRAPERRVFKVFVGNMDDKDIEAYVQRVANKFKRQQIQDPRNGQVDARHNQMSVESDFFVPVRDPNQSSPIETLAGACISLDTEIPLLDGRTLKLNDIIEEWDKGNRDLWVYSADPKTGAVAPGMITWAGITRKNTDVLKITLDNGEELITTPDHKFVHRTNGFVEAQNLVVGDSLMPFYTQQKKVNPKSSKYEQIWDNEKQKWVFTHRMVANFMKNYNTHNEMLFKEKYINESKLTIHHKNINRYDNSPSNLYFMNNKDHYDYHSYNFNKDNSIKGGIALKNLLNNDPKLMSLWKERLSINSKNMWNNLSIDEKNILCENISKGLKTYHKNLSKDEKEKTYSRLKQYQTKEQIQSLLDWNKSEENLKSKGIKISNAFTDERRKQYSLSNVERFKDENYKNKVFSKKQTLTFNDEIYNSFINVFETNLRADKTLQILNNDTKFISIFTNLNKDIRSSLTNLNEFTLNHVNNMLKQRGFKNFCDWKHNEMKQRGFKRMVNWKYYVDKKNKLYNHKIVSIELHHSKMDTGTITVDGNEQYIDYHTFATKSGVFIKNSNLGEIGDIEYIQKKMLAGLRVPKAFLGFEEVVGDGKSLALMDIRFARAISRVQRSLIQELNKIALIHLYILGLEDELYNFTLGLTNPSSQSELLKIEQWKEKITLYKDATSDQSQLGILPVSHTWAKKNILGMSESEVLLDLEQQRLERAIGFELINTQKIIPRSGVFDNVDRKYGISEEEREEAKTEDGGGEMGGAEMGGGAEMVGGEMAGALSESERKKRHHLINEENVDFTKLFKAKNINDNIYEIDQKINEILNENIT
jgi:hypothetical protein